MQAPNNAYDNKSYSLASIQSLDPDPQNRRGHIVLLLGRTYAGTPCSFVALSASFVGGLSPSQAPLHHRCTSLAPLGRGVFVGSLAADCFPPSQFVRHAWVACWVCLMPCTPSPLLGSCLCKGTRPLPSQSGPTLFSGSGTKIAAAGNFQRQDCQPERGNLTLPTALASVAEYERLWYIIVYTTAGHPCNDIMHSLAYLTAHTISMRCLDAQSHCTLRRICKSCTPIRSFTYSYLIIISWYSSDQRHCYLNGTRVGEASHPGPDTIDAVIECLKHLHVCVDGFFLDISDQDKHNYAPKLHIPVYSTSATDAENFKGKAACVVGNGSEAAKCLVRRLRNQTGVEDVFVFDFIRSD